MDGEAITKPAGRSHDAIAMTSIFFSPSILCAGTPLMYSTPVSIEHEGRTVWCRMALQLRVAPDAYTSRPNNISGSVWPKDLQFDPAIPNNVVSR